MNQTLPNSYCKSCYSFSMKFSNDTCMSQRADGSRCKAALFGIHEGGLKECSVCEGSGKDKETECIACQGYGVECVGK